MLILLGDQTLGTTVVDGATPLLFILSVQFLDNKFFRESNVEKS